MFEAGFEFTFTSTALVAAGAARGELDLDTPENLAASARLATALYEAFAGAGVALSIEDDGHCFPRHVLTFPDGDWLKVEIDPWVVEVTGTHKTIAGYRAIAPRLERVFAVAAACELAPHERIGGGHIHISRTSFAGGIAIRNFVVDYANHAELALGVLGRDPLNGPPLATAPASARAAFAAALAAFDAGEIDLARWLERLRTEVYTFGAPQLPARAPRSKYQALSVDLPETIELRAIRPQRSFVELVAVLELLAARVAFLSGRGPIPYRDEAWPADTGMPDDLARDRFATYLAEMGLAGWTRPQRP